MAAGDTVTGRVFSVPVQVHVAVFSIGHLEAVRSDSLFIIYFRIISVDYSALRSTVYATGACSSFSFCITALSSSNYCSSILVAFFMLVELYKIPWSVGIDVWVACAMHKSWVVTIRFHRLLLEIMAEEVEKLFAGLNFTSDETTDIPLPGDPTDLPPSVIAHWAPWTFNGDLVALHRYDPSRGLGEYDFHSLSIWVRIYDLPLGWMNARVGASIANRLVEAVAVDLRTGAGRLGSYLRIRVNIDIRKPLRRCVSLGTRPNGKPRLCILKYERLPTFSFRCGIVGHLYSTCTLPGSTATDKIEYGEWLRVSLPGASGSTSSSSTSRASKRLPPCQPDTTLISALKKARSRPPLPVVASTPNDLAATGDQPRQGL
ncbi:hypothetical protein F3Y22_tig00111238pilonHSYRG00274 [Hibiscus syriacus]|uniref:DUF4283 domain-containing protein n=1 Tax=Hibiscus syriacus TaxID=106335 RepID=A0A6A2YTD6_HIBSY|nr:hypothetical protein F3Y22_tig00111238pilonHSYRG00274 [Hibiscus syriacus]